MFATTQWSMVIKARDEGSPQADAALERLCRTYWYPLYVFIRRSGATHCDAEDLTQAFFARLLEKRYLSGVDRSKGKFRSFLLAAFQHFASNQRRSQTARKRGGSCSFISLNDASADEEYLRSAPPGLSPEQLFLRQWATTLLDAVVSRLEAEFVADGKAAVFENLKTFLTGDKRAGSYPEVANRLGTTEAALRMTVSRMRQRYGELVRAEIASTVSSPDEIDGELRALLAALS